MTSRRGRFPKSRAAWLDTDDFYNLIRVRTPELLVLKAMFPNHSDLISVDDVSETTLERRDMERLLWQAYSFAGLERISQWLWSLYQYPGWDRSTRLTVPLLVLDELMIHQWDCRPYEQGELNIHARIYPKPTLFDRFDGPADISAWASKNFDLGPTLRLVDKNLSDSDIDRSAQPFSDVAPPGDRSRLYERRQITPNEGNVATIVLYQDIYEVALGILALESQAKTLAASTLKWYFAEHKRPLTLEAARPIALGHVRQEALAELAGLTKLAGPIDTESLVDQFTAPDLDGSADAEADRVDRRLNVIQSLRLLTTEESGALVLRYCYDLPYDKLAHLMDCDVPTIRRLVAQAMKTFVANLESA
jgi:hypothetical protein